MFHPLQKQMLEHKSAQRLENCLQVNQDSLSINCHFNIMWGPNSKEIYNILLKGKLVKSISLQEYSIINHLLTKPKFKIINFNNAGRINKLIIKFNIMIIWKLIIINKLNKDNKIIIITTIIIIIKTWTTIVIIIITICKGIIVIIIRTSSKIILMMYFLEGFEITHQ